MDYDKPSLNQISFLADNIQKDENLSKHFDLENAFDKLVNIKSVKQLRYFNYLLLNKKYIKLNGILTQFGFKQRYEQ